MSIQETIGKIKGFLQFPPADFLIVIIIILVGFSSFGLGRLSKESIVNTPVRVVPSSALSASVEEGGSETSSSEVVGSKNGTKYHFPWCAGAQQIAPRNLITFSSIEAARKAGYTPAGNCKGLE